MLNVNQVSEQIAELAAGRLSAYALESWFHRESRNVHTWGDADLNAAVSALDAVFSEYHFGGIGDETLALELAEALRPFEDTRGTIVQVFYMNYRVGGERDVRIVELPLSPQFATVTDRQSEPALA